MDYYVPLIADNFYHVVNRAVGSEKLFKEPENYRFFLKRFEMYISPVANIFSYALIPNHFHFLIQVKKYHELLELYKHSKKSALEYDGWQPEFVIQQFSNLLNSYAKSFNAKYKRKGALFMDSTRRVKIKTDARLCSTVFYIHKNPVHHGCCKQISDWQWSSYNTILSNSPTKIERQKVLDMFGNAERFIDFHNQPVNLKNSIDRE